ncbi:MAG: ABC transporter ATP-binding protein [Planctomycetota bacterium]|nr:ABC transporter ATP-binding protein [Planctomycetota bacterium]
MPSEPPAISARGLAKAYRLFDRGHHRVLQQMPFGIGRKFYREHWALQELDIDVARGESVAVIGRNGSGKSTFLQLLCGTTTPTRGWIETHGRIAPLLELGAGFAPEFTGRENVRLAASILGISRSEINARTQDIIDFADLPAGFIDQPVKRYSSGMYARLAFAVAIHVDADILVVDEILAVGDGAFVQKCMRAIREFKETGTLFFVSHDTPAVLALCERAIWLDKGKLMAVGPAKEVVLEYEASLKQRSAGSSGFEVKARAAQAAVEDPRSAAIRAQAQTGQDPVAIFDPAAASFGEGAAEITSVRFLDETGEALDVLFGGEVVELEITGRVLRDLPAPIVGFYVQDRLGQVLFSDNTAMGTSEVGGVLQAGGGFRSGFRFQMPWMPAGEYSVGVAIADGPVEESVPQHWIESAMTFRIHGSHVAVGLVGLPMLSVTLEPTSADSIVQGQP